MRLHFKFDYEEKRDRNGCFTRHPFAVTCKILDDAGFVIGEGHSMCNPADQFIRKVGKKIALTRAVDDAGGRLTYDDRVALWENIFPQ